MSDAKFDSLSVTGATQLQTAKINAELGVDGQATLGSALSSTVDKPASFGVNVGTAAHGGFESSGLFLGQCGADKVGAIQAWSGAVTLIDPKKGTKSTTPAVAMPLALQGNGGSVGVGVKAPTARLHVDGDVRINNRPLWLRSGTDANHGVAYYGIASRGDAVFAKTDLDGPVVFGYAGGALGTTSGAQKIALSWTKDGSVGIGTATPNAANRLQVAGALHMDGNPIYLRSNPTDQFDVLRWNAQSDRVEVGGCNGVNLCATGGGASPVMAPVLSVDRTAFVTVGSANTHGNVAVLGVGGIHRLRINGDSGEVVLRDEKNNVTVTLSSSPGDIVLAGADCAERFELAAGAVAEPGTLLVIGAAGQLEPCAKAYDKRVAGVVSGAGGIKPGMILNGADRAPHCAAIALVGRVHVKVDARGAAIEIGDLLTTSATPGHAMKAADAARTPGAVIGKALAAMADGTGLLPIIVALQ